MNVREKRDRERERERERIRGRHCLMFSLMLNEKVLSVTQRRIWYGTKDVNGQ